VVWPIRTSGIDVRHNPFHSIAIWRLRKEESVRERDHENEEKKENQPIS
jgi:hypothetical protein